MSSRHPTFLHELLEGRVILQHLHEWLGAQRALHPARSNEELLGLTSEEWQLVERTPDALRYVIYARRFARATLQLPQTQTRVSELSIELAALSCDPFDVADLDAWLHDFDASEAAQPTSTVVAHV